MKASKTLLAITLLTLIGCNGGKNQTNIELMQDMMDQINVKAQDWDPDRPGNRANMVPPANSIPRGYVPYKFAGKVLEAEANLKNPLAGDFSPQVLELGRAKYEVYCMICHGAEGKGDGPVAKKFIVPVKPLVGALANGYKDGRFFHIITEGQGLMGSYANQIVDERARWAVVNYIRTLQRNSNSQ